MRDTFVLSTRGLITMLAGLLAMLKRTSGRDGTVIFSMRKRCVRMCCCVRVMMDIGHRDPGRSYRRENQLDFGKSKHNRRSRHVLLGLIRKMIHTIRTLDLEIRHRGARRIIRLLSRLLRHAAAFTRRFSQSLSDRFGRRGFIVCGESAALFVGVVGSRAGGVSWMGGRIWLLDSSEGLEEGLSASSTGVADGDWRGGDFAGWGVHAVGEAGAFGEVDCVDGRGAGDEGRFGDVVFVDGAFAVVARSGETGGGLLGWHHSGC